MIDDDVRRMAASDPRAHNPKVAAHTPGENKRKKVEAAKPAAKPQAGQPARASKGSPVDGKSVNDWRGNQQRNMELRGATLFLFPMGEGSPVAPGTIESRSQGNVFKVDLQGAWAIDFDWSKYDDLDGSQRGNLRIDRCIPITLRIKHNGYAVTFAAGTNIHWPDGEMPDLVPDSGNAGIHIINVLCFRSGTGGAADTEVHASLWAGNSRIPA